MDMRLCITARRMGLDGSWRDDLEERLRLLLGSWTCRIRQARVYIEDVNGPRGGLDVRCAIEAALIPSGTITAQGLGTDVESAVRGAARRLVRRVKDEFYRRRADPMAPAPRIGRAGRTDGSGADDAVGRAGENGAGGRT